MRKRIVVPLIVVGAIPALFLQLSLIGFILDWNESRGHWPRELFDLTLEACWARTPQETREITGKIRAMLDRSPSYVMARDREGLTPLHCAPCREYVEIFVAKGADVNARDKDQKTPLHHAALEARVDVVEALLAHGADINAVDRQRLTPLYWAHAEAETEEGARRRERTISLLERKGATIDQEGFKKVLEYNIRMREGFERH